MSNENWSEWIDWSGGDMPLEGGTKVQVKRRDLKKNNGFASQFYWGLPNGDSSIISYRYRIEEPTKAAEGMHPDLEWLARNVSQWELGYHLLSKRIDSDSLKFETLQNANYEQQNDFYGKRFDHAQWLQARKDLGLEDDVMTEEESELPAKEHVYRPYFKDVRHIDKLDVYRVIDLFGCEKHGHPISHAVKKLLLTGVRTGGKSVEKDVSEAIDSLQRWMGMREEDKNCD